MQRELIEYEHDGQVFEGVLVHDETRSGPLPIVLICHAWAGRSDHEIRYAEKLAELGYAGFALDVHGKGVLGQSIEENQKLIQPYLENRPLLQTRLTLALDTAKSHPRTDAGNAAVMGFCFGGLCALDMARIAADIKGAASFHGLFHKPGNTDGKKISAKVIAFHGYDDPMATPDQLIDFAREMTDAEADWQVHAYGGTMHAFTNENANDPGFGTVYNKRAAHRSWIALTSFLEECFQH